MQTAAHQLHPKLHKIAIELQSVLQDQNPQRLTDRTLVERARRNTLVAIEE